MECEQTEISGTGLGLSMSKSLVEALGGKISVESQESEGSSFIIEFDLTAEMIYPEQPWPNLTASNGPEPKLG